MKLKRLDLSFSKITDEVLSEIGKIASLEDLDVMYTAITDEGIRNFKPPKSLGRVVMGPHLSREVLRAFKQAFPEVEVTYIDEAEGFVSIKP